MKPNLIPYYQDCTGLALYHAECVAFMEEMAENSVDTIVTDPPYSISFMGREWDRAHQQMHGMNDGQRIQAWHQQWAAAALRVAKPGAHLLAFGATRTSHRLTCALEDAGWEIRDTLMWLHGQGYPKSTNISKQLDKMTGGERKVIGISSGPNHSQYDGARYQELRETRFGKVMDQPSKTAPESDAAKQWDGWGSALKPAYEPIILARKPLQGTLAQNVLKWGVGALNIDACRIAAQDFLPKSRLGAAKLMDERPWNLHQHSSERPMMVEGHVQGRWPANVLLSHHTACEPIGLRQVPTGTAHGQHASMGHVFGNGKGLISQEKGNETRGYAGADGFETIDAYRCHPACPLGILNQQANGTTRFFYTSKASRTERGDGNTFPTVKPLALMRYLVRLITPPNGLILDPFAGSSTTLLAARAEGFRCIGVEQDQGYCGIGRLRLIGQPIAQQVLALE